jgi:predicted nuclease of restriction endonuclease-like (RecB) superfamily
VKFDDLTSALLTLDHGFRIEAGKSVNRLLTLRNWMVGHYIVEFEQQGEDRAEYGGRLLERLAKGLNRKHFSVGNLKIFRQFYLTYPQFGQLADKAFMQKLIRQSLIGEFQTIEKEALEIVQSPIAQLSLPLLPAEKILNSLSYTHLVQIMSVENPIARAFYEIESIRGGWSVRELKRQIGSLLYERTGLAQDKEELLRRVHQKAEPLQPADFLRSPYLFEFLDFPDTLLVDEEVLEKALLSQLQNFLLELGRGFCFEARQKRVLIGDEWHFVDLVFYHRLLRCHILIDLKTEKFKPDHAGQMNAYVNFYRENQQGEHDAPPVGLLLCTEKNETAVRYALGSLDENIFVSQYKLLLPDEATLIELIERERINFEMTHRTYT